jgi:alanyl-tRNA synthetase
VGYEKLELIAVILGLLKPDLLGVLEELTPKQAGQLVFAETPFYAEVRRASRAMHGVDRESLARRESDRFLDVRRDERGTIFHRVRVTLTGEFRMPEIGVLLTG